MPTQIDKIIKKYNLKPQENEGGYYVETYRSPIRIETSIGNRSLFTSIIYLITPDSFSLLHKLKSDEIWFYHSGDPIELFLIYPDGYIEIVKMGDNDMVFQKHIPKNTYQGARLIGNGKYALISTIVSPGFEFEDFKLENAQDLIESYPDYKDLILQFTRG